MSFEPMLYWIGDAALEHGERGTEMDVENPEACLCGHPNYLMCPNSDKGIQSWTISVSDKEQQ